MATVPSFTQKLTGLTQQTIGNSPEKVAAFFDAQRKDRKKD
jgi:hypothetical protein